MSRTVFRSLSLLVPLLLVGGCSDDHPTRGGDMRGAVCGGLLGIGCPQSHVCELPAGECRGADLQGVCVERPGGCVQVFMPVCGCDGRTYGNDCERRAAGVQKDHDGECA